MSRRGKRGVASCSKILEEDDLHIEFDEDMLPKGSKSSNFASWFGWTLRSKFSYHIETKNFDKQMWEDLWLEVKEHWNIQDDKPKKVLIKKAKKNCTNWRSLLVREYVNKNKLPFAKYDYLDPSKWDEFVASKTSDAFLERSNKSKLSAQANKDFARLGRAGYRGLKDKLDTIWPQLMQSYPQLEHMQDPRSQLWVTGRARKDKQTGLYEVEDILDKVNDLIDIEREMKEDGTYYEGREDPLTRYFGPEHGGRSRTVSDVIGSTQVHKRARQENQDDVRTTRIRSDDAVNANQDGERVDANPGFRVSSGASSGSSIDNQDIQNICTCDLLWPYDLTFIQTVARGKVYPTSDKNIPNTNHIHDDCLKVQVDIVMPGCERMPLPKEVRTDEVKFMEDTVNGYIQWPRSAIKIVNDEAPHKSTSSNGASSPFQNSPPTPACDIGTNIRGDIRQFEQPSEVNQVQQIPSNIHMDTDDVIDFLATEVKQAKTIKSALNTIRKRPKKIQDLVTQLKGHISNDPYDPIPFATPPGMFPDIIDDFFEYEALLQVFANGWIDITIINWFETFFYEASYRKGKPCGFFSVHSITADLCQRQPKEVQSHMLSVYNLHSDKEYFLAPYLADNHWSLFIISPTKKEVFILDSLKEQKDENSYLLSKVIQDVFGETEFTWTMVECQQQNQEWQGGYMVLTYMFEFVFSLHQSFPNLIWGDTRFATQEKIDDLLMNLMPELLKELFENQA